jgi:hypothetical protein
MRPTLTSSLKEGHKNEAQRGAWTYTYIKQPSLFLIKFFCRQSLLTRPCHEHTLPLAGREEGVIDIIWSPICEDERKTGPYILFKEMLTNFKKSTQLSSPERYTNQLRFNFFSRFFFIVRE